MNSLLPLLLAVVPQIGGTAQLPTTGTAVPKAGRVKIALPGDLRTPINNKNTPGDADSVFRISKPGSYYFERQINGMPNKCGIEIAAVNVDIDLNGFTLAGGLGSLDGIRAEGGNKRAIRIHNGIVSSWGGYGIKLYDTEVVSVRNLHSLNNGSSGVSLGKGSTASNISADNNGGNGASAGDGSTLERVSARGNQGIGISVGDGVSLSNCSSIENVGNGFAAGFTSSFSNCTARNNGGNGIICASANTISNCSLEGNGLSGIYGLNGGTVVTDCISNGNAGYGITLTSSGIIRNCSASYNDGTGLSIGSGGVITGNVSSNNGLIGIRAGTAVTIRGNQANTNGTYGYYLGGTHNTIVQNTAFKNPAANFNVGFIANGNQVGPLETGAGYMSTDVHPLSNFSH